MSITQTLTDEKMASGDKLQNVAEIVASARKNYGNTEIEIESPKIETTHGSMSFIHLEDDAKVHLLRNEVAAIKAAAVECAEQYPGVNIDKKIEELIATNPLFTNIAPGTEFAYI